MESEKAKATPESRKSPFRTTITKDETNHLELNRYRGPINFVADDESLSLALKALRREKVLGFDTESRPSFKKGQNFLPSLVQLCGEDTVYIFQLDKLSNPKRLFRLLERDDILKVGVAMGFDVRQLNEITPFKPQGFLDLEPLTDKCGIKNNGLRSLTAIVLGFRISKSEQRSNWGREQLSDRQIQYAATDAWVSREIYLRLMEVLEKGGNGEKP
jgi:ribonuclease D